MNQAKNMLALMNNNTKWNIVLNIYYSLIIKSHNVLNVKLIII